MKKINTILLVFILITNLIIMIGGKNMAENLYGYCGSKCKHEVYSKAEIDGRYAKVTGTATISSGSNNTGWVDITLPSGFTIDNSVVISYSYGLASVSNGQWLYGQLQNSDELVQAMCIMFMGNMSRIKIQMGKAATSNQTYNYRVILMKIN